MLSFQKEVVAGWHRCLRYTALKCICPHLASQKGFAEDICLIVKTQIVHTWQLVQKAKRTWIGLLVKCLPCTLAAIEILLYQHIVCTPLRRVTGLVLGRFAIVCCHGHHMPSLFVAKCKQDGHILAQKQDTVNYYVFRKRINRY